MDHINFSVQTVRSNDGWVGHRQSEDEKGPGSQPMPTRQQAFIQAAAEIASMLEMLDVIPLHEELHGDFVDE
jgi:hypothetical protein